ncbi:MAG: site-2 protease family protein [Myxococcales bacterium]|nr:site-2 protease family protein [Myxococcales bacterium]
MPASSPSSNDSPKRLREPETPDDPPLSGDSASSGWKRASVLFVLTVLSVFATAWTNSPAHEQAPLGREALSQAAQFTGALLAILVTHEFGHFIAAKLHGVPASPPFFIPLPLLSPFGTMGAIIRMSGRIPSRRALLDIGASGPLAGLAVAIPMYLYGASHSRFVPLEGGEGVTLGESILLKLLDRIAMGAAPAGMQLELGPVAFAAWGGLFVTMINLLPVGQLDGGHVAYSLFGRRQNELATFVHRSLLALFFVNLSLFVLRDVRAGLGLMQLGTHISNSMFWLMWFTVLAVLASLATPAEPRQDGEPRVSNRQRLFGIFGLVALSSYGAHRRAEGLFWVAWFVGLGLLLAMERRGGSLRSARPTEPGLFDHPETVDATTELGAGRKAVAVVTLLFFVLLFMPTPIVM